MPKKNVRIKKKLKWSYQSKKSHHYNLIIPPKRGKLIFNNAYYYKHFIKFQSIIMILISDKKYLTLYACKLTSLDGWCEKLSHFGSVHER